MVDHRRARLDHHVAEAADAWLTDPADTGAYSRLVNAVFARRAYVHPTLDLASASENDDVTAAAREVEEEAEGTAVPAALGGALTGPDARTVLASLIAGTQAPGGRQD